MYHPPCPPVSLSSSLLRASVPLWFNPTSARSITQRALKKKTSCVVVRSGRCLVEHVSRLKAAPVRRSCLVAVKCNRTDEARAGRRRTGRAPQSVGPMPTVPFRFDVTQVRVRVVPHGSRRSNPAQDRKQPTDAVARTVGTVVRAASSSDRPSRARAAVRYGRRGRCGRDDSDERRSRRTPQLRPARYRANLFCATSPLDRRIQADPPARS